MCLILIALDQHPEYPLIIAANRDEFYARPTAPAHFWQDEPGILAGRDLEKGGTWFGVNKSGYIAAVTNTLTQNQGNDDFISRGALVSDFLRDKDPAEEYLSVLRDNIENYDGFNLLVGDNNGFYMMGSNHPEMIKLGPGYYGISNGNLDSDWPKVKRGSRLLESMLVENKRIDSEVFFALLNDQYIPDDDLLPDTGHEIDIKRVIAPIFINGERYGTRSSTVLIQTRGGKLQVSERSYNEKAIPFNTLSLELEISG